MFGSRHSRDITENERNVHSSADAVFDSGHSRDSDAESERDAHDFANALFDSRHSHDHDTENESS